MKGQRTRLRLQGSVQIRIVGVARQTLNECPQLRWSGSDYQIDILGRTRDSVVGAGERPGKHVENSCLI